MEHSTSMARSYDNIHQHNEKLSGRLVFSGLEFCRTIFEEYLGERLPSAQTRISGVIQRATEIKKTAVLKQSIRITASMITAGKDYERSGFTSLDQSAANLRWTVS